MIGPGMLASAYVLYRLGTYQGGLLLGSLVAGAASALVAPLALGLGGLLDALGSDRAGWPAALGATVGWVALAGSVGLGAATLILVNPTAGGQLHGDRIFLVGLVAVASSALIAPLALGGALLADGWLQPEQAAGPVDGPLPSDRRADSPRLRGTP